MLYFVFLLVAGGIWAASGDFNVFTGALWGGGLSLINFDLLKRIGRKIVADPRRLKLGYFALVWVKFFILIALCFITVWYKLVNVPAFFVSLSVIVFAIIGATMYAVYQGFSDVVDEEMQKSEEKFIGWDDVDKAAKNRYKGGGKKSVFDGL